MTKTSINLTPDYTNTPVWEQLIEGMITGHNRHVRAKINKLLKKKNSSDSRLIFFSDVEKFARDEKEFYLTIEQLARTERIEEKKRK